MPVLHLRATVHLDGTQLFAAARRVSLTEFAMLDRDSLSSNAQDDGLFAASPSAMVLAFDDGGTLGMAGDTATNATTLDSGGVAVLTNAVGYVVQVAAATDVIKGLG